MPHVRARTDVRLLKHSAERGYPIPVNLAEAVYEDREVWSCGEYSAWAGELLRPLDPVHVGTASAALLNTRLSGLAPLLFLSHPSTEVVTSIGRAAETDQLQRQFTSQVGARLLAVKQRVDDVLATPGHIKRASFERLYDDIPNALTLLGLRTTHHVGQCVPFDSALQDAPDKLPDGSRVRVVRPGLQTVSSGELLLKPRVEYIADPDSKNG